MKAKEWTALFAPLHPEQDVRLEFRLKTGIDEGDVFHAKEAVVSTKSAVDGYLLLKANWDLVGGW